MVVTCLLRVTNIGAVEKCQTLSCVSNGDLYWRRTLSSNARSCTSMRIMGGAYIHTRITCKPFSPATAPRRQPTHLRRPLEGVMTRQDNELTLDVELRILGVDDRDPAPQTSRAPAGSIGGTQHASATAQWIRCTQARPPRRAASAPPWPPTASAT